MTGKRYLTMDSVVQRDPDQIAAKVDDDVVMVNVETGYYYAVSDVAREIWEAIERPRMISELIDVLSRTYDVDRPTCEAQTISFLEHLLAERLLRVKDGHVS